MMVSILDENGELALATLETRGRHTVAIVAGRMLIPGAFTVLSEAAVSQVQAAEARAGNRPNRPILGQFN